MASALFFLVYFNKGCSKSPGKNDCRISALRCFCATHVLYVYAVFLQKEGHFSSLYLTEESSSARNFCALNFSALFLLLFEQAINRKNKCTLLISGTYKALFRGELCFHRRTG